MKLEYLCNMKLHNLLTAIIIFTMAIPSMGQSHERLTNLPHIYINTYGNKSITSKETYLYATMWYVDEDDNVTEYDSLQIRGRGNSTWSSMGAKKPYKIKFLNKEKFLGKGYANCKPWTLLANTGDKSLIRNAITARMGDFLGLKNPPAHKFADLTLNGTYMGNYMISDHIDVRPHRVNITEQDYPLTEESDITGGYLLEVDGFHDGNCFASSKNVYIRIHYPEEEEIAASQNTYIRNYINQFETALFSSEFTDEETGYRSMVDSMSLVNWFLTTEITANIDGYYSTYFYKEQGDPKLYFGPCWDYDIAYDNDTRITPNTERLMTDYGYGDAKTWVNRMWNDPWFAKLVYKRYCQVLDDGLVDFMYDQIDSLATLLDESQQLNYKKWGINTKRYHEVVLYSSYSQYLTYIKNFIANHTAWLKTTFANKTPKEPTPAFTPGRYYYRIANKGSGTLFDITDQDTLSGHICGWTSDADRLTEDWIFTPVGDFMHITNRCGGMALNDPSSPSSTSVQLNIAEPDTTSDRQLWTIVPQGYDGYYNLKNKYTGHAANLSGGNRSNGATILSYTSDTKDATSNNRLWSITASTSLPEPIIDNIDAPDAFDYVFAYDSSRDLLHFGCEDRNRLDFTVTLYNIGGMIVGSFNAGEGYSISHLPVGTYIANWAVDGTHRSIKFRK